MDIGRVKWRKSSYSSNNGGACVEVCTSDPAAVVVRDSKDPDGSRLAFSPGDWQAFTAGIKGGQFDLA
jgi:Domain of unknown function (DUF397)